MQHLHVFFKDTRREGEARFGDLDELEKAGSRCHGTELQSELGAHVEERLTVVFQKWFVLCFLLVWAAAAAKKLREACRVFDI